MLENKRPIRTFEALKPSFLKSLPLSVNPKRPTCQRTKVTRSVIEGKESKPPKGSVGGEVRWFITTQSSCSGGRERTKAPRFHGLGHRYIGLEQVQKELKVVRGIDMLYEAWIIWMVIMLPRHLSHTYRTVNISDRIRDFLQKCGSKYRRPFVISSEVNIWFLVCCNLSIGDSSSST